MGAPVIRPSGLGLGGGGGTVGVSNFAWEGSMALRTGLSWLVAAAHSTMPLLKSDRAIETAIKLRVIIVAGCTDITASFIP
jgi:hypothetical protein